MMLTSIVVKINTEQNYGGFYQILRSRSATGADMTFGITNAQIEKSDNITRMCLK